MTIEHTSTRAIEKPWGRTDLRPWSEAAGTHGRIGEIWYERADSAAHKPSLLLKLLFTREPLSVQVHPGDAFAQSIGEVRGKSEAWYIMSAEPGGRIALGLDRRLTSEQLRDAIADGSIAERIAWRDVSCGDVVDVPAGSIHAVGAGLVIAEIQQRSDTTFRLFDYGRCRDLHVEQAIAVANAGVGAGWSPPEGSGTRTNASRHLPLLHPREDRCSSALEVDDRGAARDLAAHPKRLCPDRTYEHVRRRGGLSREGSDNLASRSRRRAGSRRLRGGAAGRDDASPGPRNPIPYQRSRLGVGRGVFDDVTASAPDIPGGPTVTN